MVSRTLQRALERHADHLSERIDAARLSTGRVIGDVASVSSGAAQDGLAVVSVTVGTSETTAAGYATSYTPRVGDRVMCTLFGAQLFVDYAIGGAP